MMGDRQRDGHLAIVLLAELPAILPRHPDRMGALLGKPCVVDDQGLDRPAPLHRRHDQIAHLRQNPLVRPRRLTDEVQERLMLRRNFSRRGDRRHRLDALALPRHQQPETIVPQRRSAVGVTDDAPQTLDIAAEPRFTLLARRRIHCRLRCSSHKIALTIATQTPCQNRHTLRPSDSAVSDSVRLERDTESRYGFLGEIILLRLNQILSRSGLQIVSTPKT